MTRILLLAHAPLASALRDVAMHVFPECAAEVDVVDVEVAQDGPALEAALRQYLEAGGTTPTLILVDAFGATPCNVALRVIEGCDARVVTGVNVPMLWRTLCYRNESLDALVERACAGATQGVMALPPRPAAAAAGPQGIDR
ncbi:MAG: PTS fructose transporter subunit IIA [Rubrivivax sp.]|nr:PTS fructose transporter subunit IIA [Rubrivivax sp.]